MPKQFASLLIFFLGILVFAQVRKEGDKLQIKQTPQNKVNSLKNDTAKLGEVKKPGDSLTIFIPTISDYLVWTEKQEKYEEIDTALTIEGFYQQNFTQEDKFGTMAFPNIGQSFNPLEYKEEKYRLRLLPTGKSFNYIETDQIKYFDVKTPVTEFFYENGVREGQSLSTTFTHSPNKQVNYSVRYRGLRSLGRFQEQLAANNSFITTLTYKNTSERFRFWTHYASQNINNEENAGITNLEDFTNSSVAGGLESLEVNLTDVISEYDSRRFYLASRYAILKKINPEDSTTYFPAYLKNVFSYEKQKFLYQDTGATNEENDAFYQSSVIEGIDRINEKNFENLSNTITAAYNWNNKLLLEAGLRWESIQYYYDNPLINGLINIPDRIKDNVFSLVGGIDFDWNQKIQLTGNVEFSQGDFFGTTYEVNSILSLQPIKDYNIKGGVLLQSKYPNVNLILNQSFYENFNYFNASFENQDTQKLFGSISSQKYRTDIEGSLYNINNYTYLNAVGTPRQLDGTLNLFKIRAKHNYQYKNFNVESMLQYQKVTSSEDFLPLPDYFGRVTIYYQNHAFKKAAEVQLGLNFNYFSSFQSREFFAINNEFQLQNAEDAREIGAFPLLDIFLNMKVKRFRFYLRADHVFGLSSTRNYFSTPNIPYRNFKIQFGIHWFLFT